MQGESLSEEDYNAHAAVRHSLARKFRENGAAYFKAVLDGKIQWKETDSMRLGTAVHMALNEPARFECRYLIVPKVDRRTREGKAKAKDIEEELKATGKIPIDQVEYNRLVAMIEAIKSHDIAPKILEKCDLVERSSCWKDDEFGSGLLLKRRTDLSSSTLPLVTDLKTSADPSPGAFEKSIVNYGYDTQMRWYISGEAQEKGCTVDDVIYPLIAVESEFPFRVRVVEMTAHPMMVEVARQWCVSTLGQIAERYETGDWTDDWARGLSDLQLPGFYQRERGVG